MKNGTPLTGDIEQAHRGAEAVRRWLEPLTGFEVHVRPVLVYAGWFIDHRGKRGEVAVVTASQVAERIPREEPKQVLTPDQVALICAQLEHRCRDVAF